MDEKNYLEQLAAFLSRVTTADLPHDVVEKSKDCILDVVECVYGANPDDSRIVGARNSISLLSAGSSLWGTSARAAAADAAFYNALCASVSYRNDLERKSGTHAGAVVTAAAVSAAETYGVGPADTLAGVVCGYEAMARLGRVLQTAGLPHALRISALTAAFGAAAAVSRTLSFPERQFVSALSFACHSASGNNQWGIDGTGEDVFQAGWGARNGYQAAMLAMGGAEGTANALEGPAGFLEGVGARSFAPLLAEDLGKTYYIRNVEFKPVEGCLMVQTPAQAAAKLAQKTPLSAGEIMSVQIYVSKQAKDQPGCDSLRVHNVVQAKMNIRYATAAALIRRSCEGIPWYPPFDEGALRLMERCSLEEASHFTAVFPQTIPAKVVVRTASSDALMIEQPDFQGLTRDELAARFQKTVSARRSACAAEEIRKAIDGWLSAASVAEIINTWR